MTTTQQPAAGGGAAPRQRKGPAMGFVLAHEQFPAPHLVDYGVAAERAGFDMVWTSDHFQPWQDNQGHAGLAWVTLAALGQRVERLTMGTGVTCPTFRYRPAVVAEAFTTLSLFSPGRIFLGLGTGEKLNEGAAGGGWALYPERAARLVEAVQIIRRLWSGEQVTFDGQYYQVDAKLYDTPPVRIPLYIAASGPKSARLSGQYGDGLIADPNEFKHNPAYLEAWREGARAGGKDPDTLPILLEHFVSVSDTQEAARGAALWRFLPKAWKPGFFNDGSPIEIQQHAEQQIPLEQVYGQWAVSTDPEVHIQKIQELVDKGVTHIFIHSAQEDQGGVVNFFGEQVLPRIKEGAVTGTRTVTA
ncbi:MAG: TIGR03557 family F420-dependent LLM class oxidoreductase [Chloroflexi bacterium]|nr:TIGR03557 family F420-dependent LLM class oxidoreductase [Chloroflexota bacterium]